MDVELYSDDGELAATVSTAGAVMHRLEYQQQPVLWQAPWLAEQIDDAHPELIKRLAGEWPAVPFGCVEQDDGLFFSHAPHGLPVNGDWQIASSNTSGITLTYDFPEDYPLLQVRRDIRLQNHGQVALSLTVMSRIDCQMPIGLHPVFPLPEKTATLEVHVAGGGIVYPRATEPGVSLLVPGENFASLAAIATQNGGTINLSQLPLRVTTEEIVQMTAPEGEVVLNYRQSGLRVVVNWQKEKLPHCLLWLSQGGRSHAPWNGRNYCLGVEPICSAWDCGPLSLQSNPFLAQGMSSAVALLAQQPWCVDYQLTCSLEETR